MKKLLKVNVMNAMAFLIIAVLSVPTFSLGIRNHPTPGTLSDDQKISHVLNRLGFGVRPGDIKRVKKIGLKQYIERQLDPASIPDNVADLKVQGLDVFSMPTSELFAKYPNPGALLRQLDGNGRNAATSRISKAGETGIAEQDEAKAREQQRERRQKLQKLYRDYDLKPANQILPQIVSNRFLRAVYSERQLQEVMVDFWQNHFNVYAGKAAVRWYIPSYERDVLRKNALGNFRDLVVGTAQHPAMLFFLDNFQSVSPAAQNGGNQSGAGLRRQLESGNLNSRVRERIKQRQGLTDAQLDQRLKQAQTIRQRQRTRGINENYARELMELHTLGVDSGYTQQDIIEAAKAFTGWTIADPRGYRTAAAENIKGTDNKRLNRLQRQMGTAADVESGEFYFNANWHDNGTKTVLGQKVNEGGIKDGLKVIDILVKSPATARFIARKLAVKFVNDDPSDALVVRVAKAFSDSNGDIKSTLRALFSDDEFFAPINFRAKIKTPFELAVSAVRTLGAETSAGPGMVAMLNKIGEVPYGYQAPTGYPDTAEDWVNTGALLERLNFAVAFSSNQIPGTKVDLSGFISDDKSVVLEKAIFEILGDELSTQSQAVLLKQVEQPLPVVRDPSDPEDLEISNMRSGQAGGRNRIARMLPPSGDPEIFKIVSLVLGTPEFQRQ